MNKELQKLNEIRNQFARDYEDAIKDFFEKNFPVGSKIEIDGEELEVTEHEISYINPCYIRCSKYIRQDKTIPFYNLVEMIEKREKQ